MSSSTQSSSEPLLDINTVAAEIRQAIMDGKLVPGQRLVEVDLCREFNASRGVVRSAIFDLTHEGLLERRPNRGAEVRRVSVDEAIAITELRMVVEALCASKAALLITDEEIRELRQLGEDLKSAVANADHARYTDLNQLLQPGCRRSVAIRLRSGSSTACEDKVSSISSGWRSSRGAHRYPCPSTWPSSMKYVRDHPRGPNEQRSVIFRVSSTL